MASSHSGASRHSFIPLVLAAISYSVLADVLAFLNAPQGARWTSTRLVNSTAIYRPTGFTVGSAATATVPVALLVLTALVNKRRSPVRQGLTACKFFGNKDKEEKEVEEEGELSEAAKANVEKLQMEIEDLKVTAEEKKAAHERLKLEIDNFRARTRSELAVARSKAAIPLVQQLLPIADEFDLAKQNLKIEEPSQQAIADRFQSLFDKMLGRWKQLGIQKLTCLGEEFNPELHEAVSMIPSQDYKADLVCNELRAGWAIKAPGSEELQVLRPSLVCVSAGPGPS